MKLKNSITGSVKIKNYKSEPVQLIKEIRNYLAGQTIGITNDAEILEEIIKIIFSINLINEYSDLSFSSDLEIAKIIRINFSKIKNQFPDYFSKDDEILLSPNSISMVYSKVIQILNNKKRPVDIISLLYESFIGDDLKGRDGQFFTPKIAVDFLIEAVGPEHNWNILDSASGSGSFLTSCLIYLKNIETDENKIKLFAKNKLSGIDKDNRLVRLSKINLSLISGVPVNISCKDSLESFDHNESMDLIITNPPFGSKIVAASEKTMKNYELGYKWKEGIGEYIKTSNLNLNTPPQVLFIERNIKALKGGGILASVIPESLISNKNYKYVVEYIKKYCSIEAIFGMPESLFKVSGKSGTHTKTSLVILKKKKNIEEEQKNKIFMAEAKWCGHDSRGNSIKKNDLPKILENYKKHIRNDYFKNSSLGYVKKFEDLKNNILAPSYYDIDFENILKTVSKEAKLITFQELVDDGTIEINTGDEVGKLAYGTGGIPFVRTSDIGNWEIKNDVKQKVSEEIYEDLKVKQNVKENDIFMVKDGTYLIGTLGIVTKEDIKIVYQSHIYKIRVNNNDHSLNPYNVLSILSSNFVQRQIKAKQLSQDIIDSLGKRIYEIVFPIYEEDKMKKITNIMAQIISVKTESKTLAKKLNKLI